MKRNKSKIISSLLALFLAAVMMCGSAQAVFAAPKYAEAQEDSATEKYNIKSNITGEGTLIFPTPVPAGVLVNVTAIWPETNGVGSITASYSGGSVEVKNIISDKTQGTYQFLMPEGDVTINAEFVNVTGTYKVTFYPLGGSNVASQTVEKNGTVTEPDAPVREGYTFLGWYSDTSLTTKYDFSTPITDNLRLYANWDRNKTTLGVGSTKGGKYSVSAEGRSMLKDVGGSSNNNIFENMSVTLNATPDFGYKFKGWYEGVLGSNGYVESHNNNIISTDAEYTFTIKSDTALRAVFEKINKEYTVKFETNGGTNVSSQTVEEGKKAVKPSDPYKSQYALEGWYTDAALTKKFDFDTAITSDITLYAKWVDWSVKVALGTSRGGNYDVSIFPGDKTGTTNITCERNTEITLSATPDPGYTFKGWYEGKKTSTFVEGHTGVLVSKNATYKFKATGDTALYALFDGSPLLKSIEIYPKKTDLATRGKLYTAVNYTPSDASNKDLVWKSSNEKVASVDSKGVVTAHIYGKPVTITATSKSDNSIKATATVQTRFYDVYDSSKYYYKPVYWAANNGITGGYSGGVNFGPQRSCTRAELVLFLWRLKGRPDISGSVNFSDISYKKDSDNYKAILWGYKRGIIGGYDDGTFKPNDTVKRRDAMLMLYRVAGKPSVRGTVTFTDVKSAYKQSSGTYKAILWGTQKNIAGGYNDGTFKPNDYCLREHIVTFIYRYDKNVK